MLLLPKINSSFSKNCLNYNLHSPIQRSSAEYIVEKSFRFVNFSNKSLLFFDFGSGTGHLSESFYNKTNKKIDVAIDLSSDCLAINNHSQYKLIADIKNLPFCTIDRRSVIYSSFCLQWLLGTQIVSFFNNIDSIFRPGSIFCFTFPVLGSFIEFGIANKESGCNFRMIDMPNVNTFLGLLKNNNYKVLHEEVNMHREKYSDALSFLKSIKNIGAGYQFSTQNFIELKKIKKIDDILLEKFDNRVTWKVFNIIFEKII